MTANDNFFQELKPAAVLKHSILGEYCTVFTSMVGHRFPGPVWLIDGYAGPGWYGSTLRGGARIAGSPIVAMRIAQKWRKQGTRDLRCVFIEADPGYATELTSNLEQFSEDGLHPVVLQGPVQTRLADAWDHVSGGPVVTFLDPFGVAMPSNLMTDLLLARGRPRPSEVLLNINLEAVARLGGLLEERDGSIVAKHGLTKGVERVDDFFGDRWWRKEFYLARTGSAAGSAATAAELVVAKYRKRTEAATGCMSMSIPIRRRPGHPALFHLTLFYRQPVAGYKFADAARRANRKWRDAFRAEDLADALAPTPDALFDLDREIRASFEASVDREENTITSDSIRIIKSNILALLQKQQSVSLAEHIVPILGKALSLAGEPEICRAWDQLSSEGLVAARDKSQRSKYTQSIEVMR